MIKHWKRFYILCLLTFKIWNTKKISKENLLKNSRNEHENNLNTSNISRTSNLQINAEKPEDIWCLHIYINACISARELLKRLKTAAEMNIFIFSTPVAWLFLSANLLLRYNIVYNLRSSWWARKNIFASRLSANNYARHPSSLTIHWFFTLENGNLFLISRIVLKGKKM